MLTHHLPKRYFSYIVAFTFLGMFACSAATDTDQLQAKGHNTTSTLERLIPKKAEGKPVVYQVFTRLFGNTNTTNKPWGMIEDNGVGKFSDFTDNALHGKVGGAQMGKPALVVSALISRSSTLLYFGQDVAEDGSEDLGFADPSRTSIFDYGGVPAHQRWMNNGKFDGGQLSASEKALRSFYIDVMKISAFHPAMLGDYMPVNFKLDPVSDSHTDKLVAFVRYTDNQRVLVVSHFDQLRSINLAVTLTAAQLDTLRLKTGVYRGVDLLTGAEQTLIVEEQLGVMALRLAPMQSVVIQL
jgi:hypothetical protein